MRVFILGAGASFHAGYPLTKDLGGVLINWAANNPRPERLTQPTATELAEIFKEGRDVELTFTALDADRRFQLLEAIRDLICERFDATASRDDAELYKRLARNNIAEGDTIVTFNYDVSMELALRRVDKWHVGDGYGFVLGEGITPPSAVRVLKLHGSTSWLDVFVEGGGGGVFQKTDPSKEGCSDRPRILPQHFELFGYAGHVCDPEFMGASASGRDYSFILPTKSKNFGKRKLFWDNLWDQATGVLRRAQEIVVIGYSLPLVDERAKNLILGDGNKDAQIKICCLEDNHRLGGAFQSAGFTNISTNLPDFESWLDSAG